jgi:hypothetical protein
MRYNPFPLHPTMIRPADEPTRIDLGEHTQEVLAKRSRRALPTVRTTAGRREWRWGRPADGPSSSGAPKIFSPTDLERAPAEESSKYGSVDELRRRLKP